MTKRQEFRVLQTYSDFEMREYQPGVIAEVKVSAGCHRHPTAGDLRLRLHPSFKLAYLANR